MLACIAQRSATAQAGMQHNDQSMFSCARTRYLHASTLSQHSAFLLLGFALQLRNMCHWPALLRWTYKRLGFPFPLLLSGRGALTTLPISGVGPLVYAVGRPIPPPSGAGLTPGGVGWGGVWGRQMAYGTHEQRYRACMHGQGRGSGLHAYMQACTQRAVACAAMHMSHVTCALARGAWPAAAWVQGSPTALARGASCASCMGAPLRHAHALGVCVCLPCAHLTCRRRGAGGRGGCGAPAVLRLPGGHVGAPPPPPPHPGRRALAHGVGRALGATSEQASPRALRASASSGGGGRRQARRPKG